MIFKKLKILLWILLSYFSAPFIYFLISRKKREKKMRILIIPQLARIGDLVCTTPVFRAIKEKYPQSYLAVLVSKRALGIIKNNPRIDEIIIYENFSLGQLIKKIRKISFDWSFSLSATSVSSPLVFLGLVKNRVKTTRQRRPLTEFLTDWLNNHKMLYQDHTYLPRHHLKLLSFLGINNPVEIKEVFVSPAGQEKARKILEDYGLGVGDFLVGISMTAGNKIKEWGDEKFKELAKQLVAKYHSKIIFLGAKKDEPRIDKVLADLDQENYFKAINFSLEELPSLVKRLKLYIAVDTGPIYIAHALGVPLVDIVGPCDPGEQPPQDSKSILIVPPPSIKPSSFVMKKAGKPEEHLRALESIKVEDVLNAADRLILRFII